jgi:uncharacterized protein YkwD
MRTPLRYAALLGLIGSACLAAPAGGDEPADKTKLSPADKQILDLTNQARKKEGLAPLRPNATLMKVARDHSANMAKQQKLDHVLDGMNPFQRIKAAGYRYARAGENIAFGTVQFGPAKIFGGWMKSKHHRENILNPLYTEVGIGRAANARGEVYYTQVFGRPLR